MKNSLSDIQEKAITVSASKPFSGWGLYIENNNINGHRTGVFIESGEDTQIAFTENLSAKNFYEAFYECLFEKTAGCVYF